MHAMLEVIIVVETDTEHFRGLQHRRQYPNCVQVDCVHGRKISSCAQQICTLRNQFGQNGWRAAFALRKAMSAPPFSKWTMRIAFLQWQVDDFVSPTTQFSAACAYSRTQ
jgi:hypothetical protein